MNIYLDIDGVLLANENALALHADAFLKYVITQYPDSTYWLTTHCWRGENRALELLTPLVKPETAQLLKRVQPTEWGTAKTDAIDFSKPFLWFDDDLYDDERKVLIAQNRLDCWVEIDLRHNPESLKVAMQRFKRVSKM